MNRTRAVFTFIIIGTVVIIIAILLIQLINGDDETTSEEPTPLPERNAQLSKMDYGPLLAAHVSLAADMTVCCIEVPLQEAAGALGVMTVDESGRIIAFDEKPAEPASIPGKPGVCLASMGNYVFNRPFLFEQVIRDADTPGTQHDFGRNIIPSIIDKYRVFAYPFRDPKTSQQAYWRDVGTLDAFWQANMELITVTPQLNLYDRKWPIFTNQRQSPPAKFVFDDNDRRGEAIDSMIAGGCVISGASVKRSLFFTDCRADEHSVVRDSVILPDVDIGRRCRISNCIIDRGAIIKDDMVIGEDPDEDRARNFRITEGGLTLVTPDMLVQDLHYSR